MLKYFTQFLVNNFYKNISQIDMFTALLNEKGNNLSHHIVIKQKEYL